ncbi:hypothetical protein [Ornithinibacillus xuwenensis]|uniref:Uncharacterized protein n=1 Tax=Ornithinibacillus xuwenensis TaxID=3144668 RepID=A0ABU9XJA3_9BACI
MKFIISDSQGKEMHKVDVNNSSILYLDTKHINMEAGGYLLRSQKNQWNPIAVSFER